MTADRVGLGWRPELAAGIFDGLDRIDILELGSDEFLAAGRQERRGLNLLARNVPVHVHSIDLGMAGHEEVSMDRLEKLARLIHDIEPEGWSEHLAFVRVGDIEIGHLAAPPRTDASIASTARNVKKASEIVGAMPQMENIATLMQPPGSTMSEQAWIAGIIAASGCGLLLDLHNLHANATNFGFDALQFLAEIPIRCVRDIHI